MLEEAVGVGVWVCSIIEVVGLVDVVMVKLCRLCANE
jgi:hypothetical protein